MRCPAAGPLLPRRCCQAGHAPQCLLAARAACAPQVASGDPQYKIPWNYSKFLVGRDGQVCPGQSGVPPTPWCLSCRAPHFLDACTTACMSVRLPGPLHLPTQQRTLTLMLPSAPQVLGPYNPRTRPALLEPTIRLLLGLDAPAPSGGASPPSSPRPPEHTTKLAVVAEGLAMEVVHLFHPSRDAEAERQEADGQHAPAQPTPCLPVLEAAQREGPEASAGC